MEYQEPLDLSYADANLKVSYSTHKKMIDERDNRIKQLTIALEKACSLLDGTSPMCPKTEMVLNLTNCAKCKSKCHVEWLDYLTKVSEDDK